MKKSLFLASLTFLINSCKEQTSKELWQPLFNGKDLSNEKFKMVLKLRCNVYETENNI